MDQNVDRFFSVVTENKMAVYCKYAYDGSQGAAVEYDQKVITSTKKQVHFKSDTVKHFKLSCGRHGG